MKRKNALVVLVLIAALGAGAQNLSLSPSNALPTIDGKISAGEYQSLQTYNGIEFAVSLSKEGILSVGVRAPTKGWIAAGLGAGIMDGAWMLLAYDAGGQANYSEQLGVAHFHQPVKVSKLLAKAVRFDGTTTTLEFQVKAADFAKGGKIPAIMAYAMQADFVSKHVRRASTTILLGN